MNDQPLHVDFDKRQKLDEILGADHLGYCYQCGACVGDCPSARFCADFNPRNIMLLALMGEIDGLTGPDSIIWECSNCYTCYDRCPQDVRPVEVITALKNMSTGTGFAPVDIPEVVDRIFETGRSVPVPKSVARQREQLGLPPLPEPPVDEVMQLIGTRRKKR